MTCEANYMSLKAFMVKGVNRTFPNPALLCRVANKCRYATNSQRSPNAKNDAK